MNEDAVGAHAAGRARKCSIPFGGGALMRSLAPFLEFESSSEASPWRSVVIQRALTALIAVASMTFHSETACAASAGEMLTNGNFTDGLAPWVGDGSHVEGERGVQVRHSLKQVLAPAALQPGSSYRLTARVRNLGADRGEIAVVFRIPEWKQSYRTYRKTVASGDFDDVSVSFTAPAYTTQAEVALSNASGMAVEAVSLVAVQAVAPTEPVVDASQSHVLPGYSLVFNDEFSGHTLDRSKWYTRHIYEGETLDHLNDEQERYSDDGTHLVHDGMLSLRAHRMDHRGPKGEVLYAAGMIRSDWTVRYGYLEARVRMPAAKGVFPAFWIGPDVSSAGDFRWPPEIDIFEYVNNGKDDLPDMLHTGVVPQNGAVPFTNVDPSFNERWTFWKAPFAFDQGWHTIAAEWTPTFVTTYVDGRRIVTRPYRWEGKDAKLAAKGCIILNFAVGGEWSGRYGIDDDALARTSFDIDWIRVYQKPESQPKRNAGAS